MIYDTFCFFEEIDLLEFRLKYLDDVVDKFIFVESNLTHSGKIKPYHYYNNRERFSKWKDKIIYLPIEQSIDGLLFDKVERYTPSDGAWLLENQQRNSLSYANNYIDDDSIVILSDLDEIPDKEVLRNYKLGNFTASYPASLTQLFHYYYMNCQNEGYERWWKGSIVMDGKYFKSETPQHIRDNRNHYSYIENAGYHFSFLNGIESIRNKIQSFAHTEFNRPELISDEHIIKCLEEGHDIFNRPGVNYKFYPLDYYPEDIRNLMLEYPQFIKDI